MVVKQTSPPYFWVSRMELLILSDLQTDPQNVAFEEGETKTFRIQLINSTNYLPPAEEDQFYPPAFINFSISFDPSTPKLGSINPFIIYPTTVSIEMNGEYVYKDFNVQCSSGVVTDSQTIMGLLCLSIQDDFYWPPGLSKTTDLMLFSEGFAELVTSNVEDGNHVPEGGFLPFSVHTTLPIVEDGSDYYFIVEKFLRDGVFGAPSYYDDWYDLSGGDLQTDSASGIQYLTFNSSNYNVPKTFNIVSNRNVPDGSTLVSGRLMIRLNAAYSGYPNGLWVVISLKHIRIEGAWVPQEIFFVDNYFNRINSVSIPEFSTETVKLQVVSQQNPEISAYPVSFDLSPVSGDTDLFVLPASVSLTPSAAQSYVNVPIQSLSDVRGGNNTARFQYSNGILTPAPIDVIQIDAGDPEFIITPGNDITVPEGSSTQISFRLTVPINRVDPVYFFVNKYDGTGYDNDFYTLSGGDLQTGEDDQGRSVNYLTFTSTNFNIDQTFNIVSVSDINVENEQGRFRVYLAGIDSSVPSPDTDWITETIIVTQQDSAVTLEIINSTDSLSISEGSSSSFTVKLSADPLSNFTVSITKTNEVNADFKIKRNNIEISGLIFTTNNWDTNQIVTVESKSDEGEESGSANLVLSGSGVVSKTITLTEIDNELGIGLIGTSDSISILEGQTALFGVKTNKNPGDGFIVSGAILSEQDASFSLSPSEYTFNSSNWNSFQYFTITSNPDIESTSGSAILQFTGAGNVGSLSIPITEIDDEETTSIIVSDIVITVQEGGTNTFTVKLSHGISGNVNVSIIKLSGGSANLSLSPTSIVFTPDNWDINQTITASSVEDENTEDDSATFNFSSSNILVIGATVLVNEIENDFGPDDLIDGGKGDIASFVNFFDVILESAVNDRNNLQESAPFKQKYVNVAKSDYGLIYQSEAANKVTLTPYIKPFFFIRMKDSENTIQDYVDSGKMVVDEMSESDLKFEHTSISFPIFTPFFQRLSGTYYLTFSDQIVPASYKTVTENILDGSRLLVQTSNDVQTMKIIGSTTSKIVLKGRHAKTILKSKGFSIVFFEPESLFMKGTEKNVTEKKILSKNELREEDGYLIYNDVKFDTFGIIENIECFFIDDETKLNISRNIQVSSII